VDGLGSVGGVGGGGGKESRASATIDSNLLCHQHEVEKLTRPCHWGGEYIYYTLPIRMFVFVYIFVPY
jgi:hypothetical protein